MLKMKNALMMFCLAVLLPCVALMVNTGTASAMTLADLQGNYRIQDQHGSSKFAGCIVTLKMENGELIGTVAKVTRRSGLQEGMIFLEDTYVDNGQVHCSCLVDGHTDFYKNTRIDILNGGRVLDFSNGSGGHLLHRM